LHVIGVAGGCAPVEVAGWWLGEVPAGVGLPLSGPATLAMSRCRSSAVEDTTTSMAQAPSNSAVEVWVGRTSGVVTWRRWTRR
jgi:hypothetical protein